MFTHNAPLTEKSAIIDMTNQPPLAGDLGIGREMAGQITPPGETKMPLAAFDKVGVNQAELPAWKG